MKKILKRMGWINHRNKVNWYEIQMDLILILISIILLVIISLVIIVSTE